MPLLVLLNMKNFCAKSLGFFFLCFFSCSTPASDPAVRIRIPQDPESLHPLSYGNAIALQLLNLVHQSLLAVDFKDKTIKPLLAVDLPSVRVQDSLSFYTYTIRPEAKWDNGSPITAADVAFTLKLLHSPLLENERWRAQYGFMKDIEYSTATPTTFTIICTGYTPEMKLMTGDFFVLPAYQLDPEGLLSSIPYRLVRQKHDSLALTQNFKKFAAFLSNAAIARDTSFVKGSGPYKLTSWSSGRALLLEKKKNWWAKNLSSQKSGLHANPEKIVYQVLPDNAAALLALKSQQVDVMDNIPLVSFQEMQRDPKYRQLFNFYTPSSYDLIFMGMNGEDPMLKDKATRQALAHLINVPLVISSLHGGLATPTVGLVHPQEKAFYNSELQPLKFDFQKSIQLLTASGWSKSASGWEKKINGQTRSLKLNLLYRAGNTDFENMALLFQQNASKVGIPISLQAMESSQINEKLLSRDFDLYFRTLVGNPFSYNLVPLLHTSNAKVGGANVTGFGNKQTDLLLERIAKEERNTEKAILLKELQQKMQEESNMVFLYFQQSKIVVSKKIDSVVVSALKPGYDVLRFIKK
ncbi:ABC transporter substrate-binding protein [Rufibacter immobilis]|uniref:ABC transporter substrate-binding protein n=1 Tax=Rufibacter immobilis TaxID=1348778 RepID=UPI0035E7D783